MNIRANLLWIDSAAGLSVGVIVVLFHEWLSTLYGLPLQFVLFLGIANIGYGVFSFTLAVQTQRSPVQFKLLVSMNLLWAGLCLFWVVVFWRESSNWGIALLVLESIFVGSLGVIEYINRSYLSLREAWN